MERQFVGFDTNNGGSGHQPLDEIAAPPKIQVNAPSCKVRIAIFVSGQGFRYDLFEQRQSAKSESVTPIETSQDMKAIGGRQRPISKLVWWWRLLLGSGNGTVFYYVGYPGTVFYVFETTSIILISGRFSV